MDGWDVWRIATSDHFTAGLIEVERDWTMADVERANLTLDVLEDAAILSMPKR